MNDKEAFARWTRRTFGLTVGGVLAGVAGLSPLFGGESIAATGARRRTSRCRTLGQTCGKGTGRCCRRRTCDTVGFDGDSRQRCCSQQRERCRSDRDCCSPGFCDPVDKICNIPSSDRDQKANFASVDGRDMLERVRALPITSWNYTHESAAVRHIGPMAQEFAARFAVGASDRSIHPIDGQGVALAAIQGLADALADVQAENQRLRTRIERLERTL